MTAFDDFDFCEVLEDTFGISVTENEASEVRTVDELVQLVLCKVDVCPSAECETQAVFHQVRNLMIENGFQRNEVRPSAELKHLFPSSSRRANWKKVGKQFGSAWPELEFPRGVVGPVGIASLLAVGIPTMAYIAPRDLNIGAGFLTGAIVLGLWICLYAVTLRLLEPLRNNVPYKTLGALVRHLTAVSPLRKGWTKERVELTLRYLLNEVDSSHAVQH